MSLPKLTTLLAFAGFVLIGANAVEAGFIGLDLDGKAPEFVPMQAIGSSSSTSQDVQHNDAPAPTEELQRNDQAMQPTNGGMNSSAAGGSSNPVPTLALPAVAVNASAQLISWLGPEGRVWLPPPYLSGVFRPPRG